MSDDKKIIFSMTGLSKSYNNNNTQVLKDIYLSFFYGAKIGIIGLNGSGKSTLLKIIAGEEKSYKGDVTFSDGYDIGYLQQEPDLDSSKTVIEIVKEGIQLGDIGSTIQSYVEKEGFSVVQDFCGHGIGQTFHKEPNILHYGKKGTGEKIKAGMIFTIEPMINLGNYETKTLNDGWTAVTKDKSLSAQFEHTVGITKDGYEIFTQSKEFN